MKNFSIWKNVTVLAMALLFVFNTQASDDSTQTTSSTHTSSEECVITDDQG